MQKPAELAALVELLRRRPIRNVVEIGGARGGTMWVWSQLATGAVVCVDNGALGFDMELDDRCVLVNGDSQAARSRAQVLRLLDDKSVDFLFIDGDHRYDAVKADADMWLPLLSPDGVVAFHDICHRWMPDHDMWRFWRDDLPRFHFNERVVDRKWPYRRYEIYDPSEGWGGIGVAAACPYEHIGLEDTLPKHCHPYGLLCQPSFTMAPPCTRCYKPLVQGEDIVCVGCA